MPAAARPTLETRVSISGAQNPQPGAFEQRAGWSPGLFRPWKRRKHLEQRPPRQRGTPPRLAALRACGFIVQIVIEQVRPDDRSMVERVEPAREARVIGTRQSNLPKLDKGQV